MAYIQPLLGLLGKRMHNHVAVEQRHITGHVKRTALHELNKVYTDINTARIYHKNLRNI